LNRILSYNSRLQHSTNPLQIITSRSDGSRPMVLL
jgi:hypothetical protein